MKKVIPIIFAILLVSLSAGMVAADNDVTPPHRFAGSVFINGNLAPDGVLITVEPQGCNEEECDIGATVTVDGTYGYGPYLNVPESVTTQADIDDGDMLDFFVNDVYANSHVFKNETYTDNFDLYVEIHPFCGDGICEGGESCSSCPADCGECPPPEDNGGPGPVGGGIPPPTCEEDWTCSDWFDCFNGKQKRVCADINDCGTNESKPAEVQNCTVEPSITPDECNTGETRCEGDSVVSCSPAGEFVVVETCEHGCTDGVCNEPPEGYNETGGDDTQPPSNPIADFFNWLFGGGVTGAATAEDSQNSVWVLFGIAIIIIVIILIATFLKLR